MMKRLLSIVLALLLGLSLVACSGDNEAVETSDTETDAETVETQAQTEEQPKEEEEKLIPTTYNLTHTTKGVKVLGVRAIKSDAQINCDWTGSGVELRIDHKGGDITFVVKATAECYFKAYVDGELNKSPMTYRVAGTTDTEIVLKKVEAGVHTVKLVKVTGHTLARAEIYSVTFAGTLLEEGVADSDLYIEFVGDSISCGWGLIGNHDSTYTAQDGSLAYPLLTANALGADYSVMALSGQGLLYGTMKIGEGYLCSSLLRNKTQTYDFERKADIVVVNVGTNDYGQRNSANISEADFLAAYTSLLNTIKQKNGEDCKIVCVYNVMNDTFASAIEASAAAVGGEENGVYLLKLDRTTYTEASKHPSAEDNVKYSEKLTELINTIK